MLLHSIVGFWFHTTITDQFINKSLWSYNLISQVKFNNWNLSSENQLTD